MKTTRLAIYLLIALIVAVIAYYVLAKEPLPGWPINLIHLLSRQS